METTKTKKEPTHNGKLALIAYGQDTYQHVTEKYTCKFLKRRGIEWKEVYQWELGDGSPGIGIPDWMDKNDPRIVAAWDKIVEGDEDGLHDLDAVEGFEGLYVMVQTDDVIVFFVDEEANELYPEVDE